MAQKTRAQLQAQIDSLLADNTAGDISATDVRTVNNSIIDSNLNLLTTDITEVEAGYLKGVTSLIQPQIATKLSTTGGAMTGAITTNSTFDGRDVAADGVTADAALPKTGGEMTGAITGNVAITGFRPYLTETAGRTLAVEDSGTFIIADDAASITFEIPTNEDEAFTLGTEIDFIQKDSGALRITSATGVTLNGLDPNTVAVTAQWGGVTIKKIAEDEWIAVGKI